MSPRELAFLALKDIYEKKAYTNIALDRILHKHELKAVDKGLLSELVYGIVRRVRTLDALIDMLAKKKSTQQPPKLRIIFHIGLYQLHYLDQIPKSAAVNTTVELAKSRGLNKLTGVVNGVLRNYIRQQEKENFLENLIDLSTDSISKLGVLHSFPDWIIKIFAQQLDLKEVNQLCTWFNKPATIDLRINPLKTNLKEVKIELLNANINFREIPYLPLALRLIGSIGNIKNLPHFEDGWYSIQDSAAQLVTYLLNPQPEETIIDACAAPGGKTTHIAELMEDKGLIIAGDFHAKKLKKIQENINRLDLKSIKTQALDASKSNEFNNQADKVLLDVPCSGLGTLHKRPDIRWRQNPEQIKELANLQLKILNNASNWVKTGGKLVYATCTLNPNENEAVIKTFLTNYQNWEIEIPRDDFFNNFFANKKGMIKVFPHRHDMDGFFMVKLFKKK